MTTRTTAQTVLAEGKDYRLVSDDAGLALVLESKAEGKAARLAGDEAARLRADYQGVIDHFPDWSPDQRLAQLWDQGGYSWLAAEEGESP